MSGMGWTRAFCEGLYGRDREYVPGGATFRDIRTLAGGLRRLALADKSTRNTVCLCTENKALLAAALLAGLSGAFRLVLPYAFSRQAVGEVLQTLPVSGILADQPGDFPPGPAVITPEAIPREDTDPSGFAAADTPFLMLFTGGSTGMPKVWSKTPRNVIAEARYMVDRFGITADDVILATVPPQHIYGLLFSVLVPLVASARVLQETCVFPGEIMKAAREAEATVLVSVPACYRVLKGDLLMRHHLRLAFSSAGPLDAVDADRFRERTGLEIHEIYGSTETGGVAVRRRGCDGETWEALEPVAWRIDDGRLQVRSPFLSPSLLRDEAGFFTTADRAEDARGMRFLLRGRTDDVVKIGGKRVDLAEIREKLKRLRGVKDALIVMRATGKGRQHELVALVATDLPSAELRRRMAPLVEPYAMPRRFVLMDRIPVTATGKYDRKIIEELLASGQSSASFAPRAANPEPAGDGAG